MQEMWGSGFLVQEDPLEKETATHSSILAWEMPWREEPGGLVHKELDMTEHTHTHVIFFKIFLMWIILKIFIDFVQILLLFLCFWFFGREACGILASWPGIKFSPPVLEGEVLTTGHQESPSIY